MSIFNQKCVPTVLFNPNGVTIVYQMRVLFHQKRLLCDQKFEVNSPNFVIILPKTHVGISLMYSTLHNLKFVQRACEIPLLCQSVYL